MGQKSRRYAVGAEGLSAYHVSLIVRKNALTSGGTRDRGQGVSLDSVKTARSDPYFSVRDYVHRNGGVLEFVSETHYMGPLRQDG